jgi:acetoacetate decarboxylase
MKFSFCMPSASPYYPQPPYLYKDNRGINIVFRTTAEALQAFMPPRLQPNPENLAFVYVGEFNVDSPVKLSYNEAGIGIPVFLDGRPGNYFICLYLDSAQAIVPGREIYGWPKKDAKITFTNDNYRFQASVTRDGIEILRASVEATEPVIPIPDQASIPAMNFKIIPSVKRDHPPDVLQLTSAESSSRRKELFRGEATLSLASAPNDRLGGLPVLAVVGGEQYVEDMSLDYGDVLVDYLAEEAKK